MKSVLVRLTRNMILGSVVVVAWMSFLPDAYGANTLILGTLTSDPSDTNVSVRVEKGRKGLRMRMRWVNEFGVDQPGGFPINISTASVTLTINGTPHSCTRNLITPGVGACGFISSPFGVSGDVDTVKVFYNGDFPAGATVISQVGGIQAFNGQTQDGTSQSTITFTAGNNVPRTPASLEMVFDISGSMAQCVVPSGSPCPPAPTRMDALKQSAQALFGMINGHAMLGDKLGVVFFSTTASGGSLQAAHDPTQVNTIASSVQSQVPTNATSIGAGLQAANTNGFSGDSNPRKFAMLFSDGEQNTPPLVSVVGNTIQVGGANYSGITVCPITAGRLTAPGFALQQQIADASCNHNNLHVRDTEQTFVQQDFDTFFVQTLNDALIGDKLEIARDATGTLVVGTEKTEKFLGNAKDTALSILLSWSGPRVTSEDRVRFRLTAPNGTVIDTSGDTRFFRNMSFTTLHFPLHQGGVLIDPKGEWRADLSGSLPLNYHMVVIIDNETLASDPRLEVQDAGVGEPIPMRVKLTEGGTPLLGATVTAELVGPQNGLNDLLARTPTPQGTPNPQGDVLGSAARGKLLLLLNDPAFVALLKDTSLPTVTLVDDGSSANGDVTANDGIYSGVFRGSLKEGHYQFVIQMSGTSAINGAFQRTKRMTLFVRSKPDPAQTVLGLVSSVPQPDGTVLVGLRATPRDRFGSFLGPDYIGNMNITSSEGTVDLPLDDKLDGTYDIRFRLPSVASNPSFTLEIMGQTVVTKSLSQLEGGVFQHAVKFICGKSAGDVVAPGTYFTAINVHNPTDKPIVLRKKFAIARPGEEPGPVSKFFEAKLGPDQAFEIDCQDIFKQTQGRGDFLKGFAVIESDVELDVVAVYTAGGKILDRVEALHVEHVSPRRR